MLVSWPPGHTIQGYSLYWKSACATLCTGAEGLLKIWDLKTTLLVTVAGSQSIKVKINISGGLFGSSVTVILLYR